MDRVVKKGHFLFLFLLAGGGAFFPLDVVELEPRLIREPLFLAIEIKDGEQVIAQPRLLGESGRVLTMNLVDRDSPEKIRLALQVYPERNPDQSYDVHVNVTLPDRAQGKKGRLTIYHGEERKMEMDDSVRPITVRLLVMRVVSPEFDSYMKLSQQGQSTTS